VIKPVTYQGIFNFNANLYALEIKSRFIDQEHANGYYRGYGGELQATVVSNQIKIGTGAFVIQGRMNEITEEESVAVPVGRDKKIMVTFRDGTEIQAKRIHRQEWHSATVGCFFVKG
ncbi:MAG: hypothetical protein NC114_11370, partial [Ruminococcus flavefaciens]|nr:hypothetical protein [Ruminococcus flavefaciens]